MIYNVFGGTLNLAQSINVVVEQGLMSHQICIVFNCHSHSEIDSLSKFTSSCH